MLRRKQNKAGSLNKNNKMSDERILSQKTILKEKLFDVKETKFESEKRKRYKQYDIERKPTVSIFPLTEDYEIYLISQYRYLYKKSISEAVAGFIDEGETALAAAKRELKEETGITASQWEQLTKVEMATSVVKGTNFLFLAKDFAFENSVKEEEITMVKLSLDEALEKVMNGEIFMSATIIGVLLLDRLRKEGKL